MSSTDKYRFEYEKRLKQLRKSLKGKIDKCPHCGHKAELEDETFSIPSISCTNEECGAIIYCDIDIFDDEEVKMLVDRWNKRV